MGALIRERRLFDIMAGTYKCACACSMKYGISHISDDHILIFFNMSRHYFEVQTYSSFGGSLLLLLNFVGFFDSEPQSFLLRALLNSVKLKDGKVSKRLFQSNYGIKCIKSRSISTVTFNT